MSRLLFVAILLAVMTGCAQTPYVLPSPPSEDLRASFGTVGLASARFTPEISFLLPAKGAAEGAQRGAGRGALVPMAVGAQTFIPYVFMAGVVLAPVGAVVGTVYGAAEALPAEEVEKAEAALTDALSSQDIQTAMREAVWEFMRRETKIPVLLIKKQGPLAEKDVPAYSAGTDRRVDTVLELTVSMLGLIGPWTIDPPLSFTMRIGTRLVRVADGTELHTQELTYLGPSRVFTAWAANDAEAFRSALDPAFRALAEKAVEEVFLLYMPDVTGVAG